MGRYVRPKPVLLIFFLTAAASLALLGLVKICFYSMSWWPLPGRRRSALKSSQCLHIPVLPGGNAFQRVGWALGVGRLCHRRSDYRRIALSFSLPFYQNFLVFAIPGLVRGSGYAVCPREARPFLCQKQNSVSGSREHQCKSGDGTDLGAGRMYFIKGGPRVLNPHRARFLGPGDKVTNVKICS